MTSQAENINSLPCWIYKSSRKDEMYIYLAEEEGFDDVPEDLRQSFGEPVFVMELKLSEQRPLARADVVAGMRSLRDEGFYLQIPPKLNPDLHFGD